MILPYQEVKRLVNEKGLVSNYSSLEEQLQPAGFDLRLGKVYEVAHFSRQGAGALKADGSKVLPKLRLLAEKPGEAVYFQRGTAYLF